MAIIDWKNIKELLWKVVSDKMEKTLVVSVSTVKVHRKYGKRFTRHKKYFVHDEEEEAHEGDMVKFIADRPRSKKKRWALSEIVSVAVRA